MRIDLGIEVGYNSKGILSIIDPYSYTFLVGRICLIAKAVAGDGFHEIDVEKILGNQ
jgi:hypothetical protein